MIKVAKAKVGQEELDAIQSVFEAGWLGMGNFTLKFEEALQAFLGAEQVVAVNTGTSALHLALLALGIGPGDEVVLPSLTFVASFQAVSATGATPIPCESDPHTLLMDLDDAQKRITSRTKVIMPVHYCGQACDMERILSWREKYNVRIIEDAAHAFGSFYKNKKIGSFGDVACFSFDPIKNITCGEGGAITTTDSALAEKIKNLRLLGVDKESEFRYRNERKWIYDVPTQGYRYHMSNINAAIGLIQLKKIEEFVEKRRRICEYYDKSFSGLSGVSTLRVDYTRTAPFMYIVRIVARERENFMNYLKSCDIETGIHYIPNHWHSFYYDEAIKLPKADQLGHEIVTLPLHCCLSDNEIEHIVKSVKSSVSFITEGVET
ncbi:MAG: hypothetical protein ACD_44C00384G0003 [uncultured bacterium]|nr:MAG: hypothetical protein ACD_44C00384G0003 [uncultured bacterium]OGT14977.1 MAG: hypothetical protein A3B69_04545 [Gammaproteobacteria bacterium RIFCSPHIGHO2_02_FULL_38_33]OGT24143.1 MAG: hypothetical protein A2W47_01125 [Gammaproteobacteria bacterium RIFCSPHIGHO2_12_38_15]OGT67367.1 MAG: hypothetical protein A3I12_08230 [Gammaproteobacteria bacterium RIFCSPLOWO2_02_FULL_38_11]